MRRAPSLRPLFAAVALLFLALIVACANYIFTAAPRKIIRSGAIVGWHGSEQSHVYIAQARGLTIRELIDDLVEQNLDQAIKDEEAAGGEARPELMRATPQLIYRVVLRHRSRAGVP